jgi:DNA-binding response OmpR family regulator
MRILLVEDDHQLANALKKALKNEGFSVDWVDNGKQAIHAFSMNETDLAIVDLGLPDIDGTQVIKTIRKQHIMTPVLILTARDSLDDKVKGLDLGADDYLVKPFEMTELFARLRVVERRLGTAASSLVIIGDVTLDAQAHTIMVKDEYLTLSRKEYMVLKVLMESAGRIQSRSQLETHLYEWGEEVASNAVEVHVHHLRKRLPNGFIKTIRGVGYTVGKT